MLGELIFWIASGVLAWVYLGYPLVVAVLGRLSPLRLDLLLPTPSVSVAIVAHDDREYAACEATATLAWWLATHPLSVIHSARRLRVLPPAQAPPLV